MKLNNLFFLIMLLSITFINTAFSQDNKKTVHGNKVIKTEQRSLGNFYAIEVKKGIAVFLKEGPKELQVKAEDNLLPYIMSEVLDGKLIIDTEPNVALADIQPIEIYISLPKIDLKNIRATSGGSLKIESPVKVEDLEIHLSGGSILNAEINCQELYLDMQGGIIATISGSAEKAEINVQGGSSLAGRKLEIQSCTITAEGNSRAHVDVKKEIRAKATGVSKIKYSGKPTILKKEATGLSVVKR